MQLTSFAGCCTAKIITGLGGTATAEHGRGLNITDRHMKELLREKVDYCRRMGYAVVTITTNNQQEQANRVLEEEGWEGSTWMSKTQHPETKLRLWWKPTQEDK